MALVHCPECGKEVSDAARTCPHCGCVFSTSGSGSSSGSSSGCATVVGLIIAALILYFFN